MIPFNHLKKYFVQNPRGIAYSGMVGCGLWFLKNNGWFESGFYEKKDSNTNEKAQDSKDNKN